jgi:ribosomal protein L34E
MSQLGFKTSMRTRPVSRSRNVRSSVTSTPAQSTFEQFSQRKIAAPIVHCHYHLVHVIAGAQLVT